jgi:hypothetical protein
MIKVCRQDGKQFDLLIFPSGLLDNQANKL